MYIHFFRRIGYDGSMLKRHYQKKFYDLVRQYFATHVEVRVVGVTGSEHCEVTERILAEILVAQGHRVRMHSQKYHSIEHILCSLIGIQVPPDTLNWLNYRTLAKAAELRVKSPPDADVIIQRFNTHSSGEMNTLLQYVHPHIGIVAAIHSEQDGHFDSFDELAMERIALINGSTYGLVNHDEVASQFAQFDTNPNLYTYGLDDAADYRLEVDSTSLDTGTRAWMVLYDAPEKMPVELAILHPSGIRAAVGAVGAALQLGVPFSTVYDTLPRLRPEKGMGRVLEGMNQSMIIDCTKTANFYSTREYVRLLYGFEDVSQRIVVIGDLDDASSDEAYSQLGALLRPTMLSWVVTVGEKAGQHFALAARQQGCQVKVCKDQLEVLQFVRSIVHDRSLVLVHGGASLCLEEVVKDLIVAGDHNQLVRQTDADLEIKKDLFAQF